MVTCKSEVFDIHSDVKAHLSILAIRFQVPWVGNTKKVFNITSEFLKSLRLARLTVPFIAGLQEIWDEGAQYHHEYHRKSCWL